MHDSTILVVDDERAVREMVRFALEREGFRAIEAADASQTRVALADEQPSLVLLDWLMPGTSGLELTRELRREGVLKETPVIMLTAKTGEGDRVTGLDSGADDYITKPFSTRELISRIHAVLRRTGHAGNDEVLELGGVTLDAASQRVSVGDARVHLGPSEFRLLQFLMSHPERVYTRSQLLDRVWGRNVYIEERTVDVHIRRLRKALSAHGAQHLVQTVRGAGYRFSDR